MLNAQLTAQSLTNSALPFIMPLRTQFKDLEIRLGEMKQYFVHTSG